MKLLRYRQETIFVSDHIRASVDEIQNRLFYNNLRVIDYYVLYEMLIFLIETLRKFTSGHARSNDKKDFAYETL